MTCAHESNTHTDRETNKAMVIDEITALPKINNTECCNWLFQVPQDIAMSSNIDVSNLGFEEKQPNCSIFVGH